MEGGSAAAAFNSEFWHSKEDKLFDGLPELFQMWKRFSETGSHTNINSVVSRFVIQEGPTHVRYRVNYTGVDLRVLVPALFEILLVFHVMEEVFFKDCEDRLKLDADLVDLRTKFRRDKEALRKKIIVSFKIPPPATRVR
jgi:hypothetical protein